MDVLEKWNRRFAEQSWNLWSWYTLWAIGARDQARILFQRARRSQRRQPLDQRLIVIAPHRFQHIVEFRAEHDLRGLFRMDRAAKFRQIRHPDIVHVGNCRAVGLHPFQIVRRAFRHEHPVQGRQHLQNLEVLDFSSFVL